MSKKYQGRDETNRSHFVNVRLSDDEWEQLNIICEYIYEGRRAVTEWSRSRDGFCAYSAETAERTPSG